MNISVCIDALYRGKTKKEAIDDVLANGISAVEFWGWEEADILTLEKYREEKNFLVAAH